MRVRPHVAHNTDQLTDHAHVVAHNVAHIADNVADNVAHHAVVGAYFIGRDSDSHRVLFDLGNERNPV